MGKHFHCWKIGKPLSEIMMGILNHPIQPLPNMFINPLKP